MAELAGPIGSTDRVGSMDVLRGFALFGVLWMNIVGFAYPFGAYFNPVYMGAPTHAELAVWVFSDLFVEGAMRTLFSILFGAGAYVVISRAEAKDPSTAADIYYRRCLGLILFGVVHAYLLLWFGDFLYLYGLIGLLLYPLRNLKPAMLLAVAALFVGVMTYKNVSGYLDARQDHGAYVSALALQDAGEDLDEDQERSLRSWERREEFRQPPADAYARDVAAYQGSYGDIFTFVKPLVRRLQSSVVYDHQLWDIAGMMLLGMALFKLGVFHGRLPAATYAAMAVIGVGGALAVNGYEVKLHLDSGFSALANAQARATYDVGRIGLAVGYIGVFMLALKAGLVRRLFAPVAAAGRMALTNYVSHSIFGAVIFYGFGFGLFAQTPRNELYYFVAGIVAFQLVFSVVWLRLAPYGPLEWLLRAFAYWTVRLRPAAPAPRS